MESQDKLSGDQIDTEIKRRSRFKTVIQQNTFKDGFRELRISLKKRCGSDHCFASLDRSPGENFGQKRGMSTC